MALDDVHLLELCDIVPPLIVSFASLSASVAVEYASIALPCVPLLPVMLPPFRFIVDPS